MKKIRNRFTGDTIESESIEYCNNGEIARYIYNHGVNHTQLFVRDGWEEVKEDNSSIEEAAKIERDKVLKEILHSYLRHCDVAFYNVATSTIERYAIDLFKNGAIWMRDKYLKKVGIDKVFEEWQKEKENKK